MTKKLGAELLGTALLVFFGVGVATLSFGFDATGPSLSAGVVATALTFGLVLMGLAYSIGPISGCHVNPAVTLGVWLSGRMSLDEAAGYWIAQFVGGILGALALWGTFSTSPFYSRTRTGLGTDGWGSASILHIGMGGAFIAEVVLTTLFVFVILAVTHKSADRHGRYAGLVIGLSLTVVHLIGIPIRARRSTRPAARTRSRRRWHGAQAGVALHRRPARGRSDRRRRSRRLLRTARTRAPAGRARDRRTPEASTTWSRSSWSSPSGPSRKARASVEAGRAASGSGRGASLTRGSSAAPS